jgi:hypothetical protein
MLSPKSRSETQTLVLSNLSSLRAGADQTAAPRRLQKPTPPGVSRTSAGQQAPEGSPSDIRDRLPKIDSDSTELAQPAFPTSSLSPRAGRLSSRRGTIAIDGERSCAGVGRRDRFVTNAIARRRPPRRSLLLAGPRATHDRKGDQAQSRVQPVLAVQEQAPCRQRRRRPLCIARRAGAGRHRDGVIAPDGQQRRWRAGVAMLLADRGAETKSGPRQRNGIGPGGHRRSNCLPDRWATREPVVPGADQSPGGWRATNPAGPVPAVLQRGPVGGGLGGLPSPAAVSR